MIILGIDPGLANTGWGVIYRDGSACRPLAYGCVSTKSTDSLASRLKLIHDDLLGVIKTYRPVEVAVESVFFGTNAKSAFATGQARGAALVATAEAGLLLGEYSPVQIKKAVVGSGAADKSQVQYMVRMLLELDHTPAPDHASDALAAAICHAHLRDHTALAGRLSAHAASRKGLRG